MNARRLGVVVAVLLALAVLTVFILDRTIWAPVDVGTGAPAAPTLAAPPADAAAATGDAAAAQPTAAAAASGQGAASSGAAAGDGARLYRIDPARSEARYEVGETFFDGNRFVVAVGRTKGVAGEIRVDTANPAASQLGEIVVDISQLTSDKQRRDNFIRRNNLMSSQFPNARFVTRSIDGFPAAPAMDTPLTFKISGDLTVKDVTKPVTWDVTSTLTADALTGSATTKVKMSDYGIGPIEIPMLATEDDVLLGLDFVAVPGE
ncbi:MAG: YceI family protein [Anaerolineae bacterium]